MWVVPNNLAVKLNIATTNLSTHDFSGKLNSSVLLRGEPPKSLKTLESKIKKLPMLTRCVILPNLSYATSTHTLRAYTQDKVECEQVSFEYETWETLPLFSLQNKLSKFVRFMSMDENAWGDYVKGLRLHWHKRIEAHKLKASRFARMFHGTFVYARPKAVNSKPKVIVLPSNEQNYFVEDGRISGRWVEVLMGLPVGWCTPYVESLFSVSQTVDIESGIIDKTQESLFWKSPTSAANEGGIKEVRFDSNSHYKLRDQIAHQKGFAYWPPPIR